jgi:hypothetical protein
MRQKSFRRQLLELLDGTAPVPRPWVYALHENVPVGEERDFNAVSGLRCGGRPVTRAEIMAAYDTLPRAVREALANANHPWAPHWATSAIRRWAPDAIIERIAQADCEEAIRRELQLLAGQG